MNNVPTAGPMVRVDPDAPGRAAPPKPRLHADKAPATRQDAPVCERKAFYELDRWSRYNDPLLVAGFLVVVASVAAAWPPYSLPAAGTLLGAGMMKLAWMMGQGK